jgi:hypothetical protein
MLARKFGLLSFFLGAGAASAQTPYAAPAAYPVPPAAVQQGMVPNGYSVPNGYPMAAPYGRYPGAAPAGYAAQAAPGQPAPMAAPGGAPCGEACPQPCPEVCPTACGCYPNSRVWASAEWLYLATSGQALPPLVTASTTGGTGALVPGNTLVYGNQRVNNEFRNGLLVNAGIWFGDDRRFGLEGNFLYLGDSSEGVAVSGSGAPGTPLIARPFFNAVTGLPDSELVAVPGSLAGTVTVTGRNSFIGGGFNFLHNLCCSPCGRLDLIYGYQYFNLSDDVTITEDLLTTTATPGGLPAGFRFQIRDNFQTDNSFNGGVIGLAAERKFGAIVVGARAAVALGNVNQVVTIQGTTIATPPGGVPATGTGGLLAQTSNIGRYEQNEFAVAPMIGLKLGVQVTKNVLVFGGYNFIYLSNVARAGDQIDLRVNPNLIPPPNGLGGPAVPAFAFRTTDFWAQGVSAGLRLSY